MPALVEESSSYAQADPELSMANIDNSVRRMAAAKALNSHCGH
jgi:hypothetical protein